MINSRFAVAVHLLSLMAVGRETCPGTPLTSEAGSESVNTNPVVVRRILGSLRKAGIVSSQPGPTGGWSLRREPEKITLSDVYGAIQDEELFSLHHSQPNCRCLVGANIQQALKGVFRDAEQALEHTLAEKTIADVVAIVRDTAGAQVG